MNQEIYLIGTYHLDPDGYERLLTILQKIAPKKILFEAPQGFEEKLLDELMYAAYNLPEEEIKKKMRTMVLSGFREFQPDMPVEVIENIVESQYLQMKIAGFEWRACRIYQKNSSCPIICIDFNEYSSGLETVIEMVKEKVEIGMDLLKDREKFHRCIETFKQKRGAKREASEIIKEYRELAEQAYRSPPVTESELQELLCEARASVHPQSVKIFQRVMDKRRDQFMARELQTHRESPLAFVGGIDHTYVLGELLKECNPQRVLLSDYLRFSDSS